MKQAKDGSVVVGRSMEFPATIPWSLAVIPPGTQGRGSTPEAGQQSKSWTSQYGIVGICGFGNPQLLDDGINTAGLTAHGLYMPNGCCHYADFKGDGSDLSEMDLISFLLGTCATLAEVKIAVQSISVWGGDPGLGFAPPLHILMHSEEGSLAIEFHPGGIQVVDNPTGVGTNSPYLDWHLTNLNNYVGLSADVPPARDDLGLKLSQFGQGGGLMGIPGDYTGPARFIRAAAFVALSEDPVDSLGAELQTMHVLNSFDIPAGIIEEALPGGKFVPEVTDWITISNVSQKRYIYRTTSDPRLYLIELESVDFSQPARATPFTTDVPFVQTAL
ncbi:MAG: linear amide C-N hydrolase [Actinomycetia bacterium]|nr:linear amide C-N hydrolase [Actinomycetes bacterium]